MKIYRVVFIIILLAAAASQSVAQSKYPNIAVMQDDDSVIVPANAFDLAGKSVVFTPQGSGYTMQTASGGFDSGSGNYVTLNLADSDSVRINLPFTFTFF